MNRTNTQVTVTRNDDNTYHVYMLVCADTCADGDYDVPTLQAALELVADIFRRN